MSTVKLASGSMMPTVGLGTWKAKPGEVGRVVKIALDAGARHIDCAWAYENEPEIGQALSEKLAEGKVKREDLFITSKLGNTRHRPSGVREALQETLDSLKLEYLDLYLIHWPVAQMEKGSDRMPKDENGVHLMDDYDYLDTWKAMEELVKDGAVKNIGISNFNSKQVQRVLDNCSVKPAMQQIEIHPFFNNKKLVDFCQEKGLLVTAYSPFASPDRPWITDDAPRVFSNETIKGVAERNGKSVAQVVLRWILQRGCTVMAKSSSAARIQENMQLFDWSLSDADMAILSGMDCGYRACPGTIFAHSPYFPFHEEF